MNIQLRYFKREELEERAGSGYVRDIPSGLLSCSLERENFFTENPTGKLTGEPSGNPTGKLTGEPSGNPTGKLTGEPSGNPTGKLTGDPSRKLTGKPSGKLSQNEKDKSPFQNEIGICGISEDAVILRMLSVWESIEKSVCLTFFWWNQKSRSYESLVLPTSSMSLQGIFRGSDYEALLLRVVDPDKRKAFSAMYTFVTDQYYHYIKLRMNSLGAEYSGNLISYPWELDEVIDRDIGEFIKRNLENPHYREFYSLLNEIPETFQIALSLENHREYRAFLEKPEKLLKNLPFPADRVSHVYIGNPWCRFQFPDEKLLFKLLDRCMELKLGVTIVWPLLQADREEETKRLLDRLASMKFHDKAEMAAGDLGMLSLLSPYKTTFRLSCGLLMEKRRRDPRVLKAGKRQTEEPLYMALLRSLGVEGLELSGPVGDWDDLLTESGGAMRADGLRRSLHLPLYQTNTSQLCPLRAMVKYKSRARQEHVEGCERFCEHFTLSYPTHLDVVGEYNSLFAVDKTLLKAPGLLKKCEKAGVNRLVWNLKKGDF